MHIRVLLAAACAAWVVPAASEATAPKPLYHFTRGSDGGYPSGMLYRDASGNLYGTTDAGGLMDCGSDGCGVVFKLAPDGTRSTVHAFAGGPDDGRFPRLSGLVADKDGNLYGTTEFGGVGVCEGWGCGTVFKIAPNGDESIVHFFSQNGTDGIQPTGGVTIDKYGSLYGTAYGPTGADGGVVFKIKPDGTETILHKFTGADGIFPSGPLAVDSAGNVYGATQQGGLSCDVGSTTCGVVFEITRDGTETTLYQFSGGADGYDPMGGVVRDVAGNLYGTTYSGGVSGSHCGNVGCGTVFKLAPNGTKTVLHTFAGGDDGAFPMSGIFLNKAGNLFGMTTNGGATASGSSPGLGVIYEIAPGGTETVLASLGKRVGNLPLASLIGDAGGNLYGVTYLGKDAAKYGTVFRVKP
jgi:uncharacterized repeat protein (TIGR03803 family)